MRSTFKRVLTVCAALLRDTAVEHKLIPLVDRGSQHYLERTSILSIVVEVS